jgi:hypothetical protein
MSKYVLQMGLLRLYMDTFGYNWKGNKFYVEEPAWYSRKMFIAYILKVLLLLLQITL